MKTLSGNYLDAVRDLRLDGFQPTTLYLAPDRTPLPFTIQDDYATFTIPVVKGYAMAVLEDAR